MDFNNMFGTGMSLGQFGYMDELEGSGREAAVEQICMELRDIHMSDPFVDFDSVIDGVIERTGLNPLTLSKKERKLIDAEVW